MVITSKITKQKLTDYSNQNNIILRDIKDENIKGITFDRFN